MVWISAGLVILAMFMGIVTASLTTSSLGLVNHLWGIQVRFLFYYLIGYSNLIIERVELTVEGLGNVAEANKKHFLYLMVNGDP